MASSSDETPYRAPNYFARARGEGYKENTELGSARNLVSFSEAWSEHRSAWKERLKGSGRDSSLTSSSPKRSEKRDALESIDNINVLLTRFRNAMGELGLPDPGPEGAGAPDLVEEGPVVARGGEKRGSLCSETLETLDKLGSALKGVAGGEPDDDVVGGSVTQASSREEEKPGPDAGEGHPPKALTRNQKKRLRRRKKKELLEQDRASSGAEAELSEPGGPSTAGPAGYDLDGYIERRRRWHLASQAFARWRKGLPSGCSPRLVRANTPDPEVLTLRLELEKLLREKSALKVKNVQLARQNENLQELVSYKISVAPQHHFVSRGSPWSSLPSSPRSGTEGAVSKPASPRAAPAEGMRGIVSPIFSDDGKKSPQTPFHPPLLGTPAAEEEVQGGRRGGSAKKFYGSRPPPVSGVTARPSPAETEERPKQEEAPRSSAGGRTPRLCKDFFRRRPSDRTLSSSG